MRVVVDSNVGVSGLNFPGHESRVLELAVAGYFEMVLSELILTEVPRSLARTFDWGRAEVSEILELLRDRAIVVDPTPSADVIPHDHSDNRVLDCPVHAQADYLVTGDRKHLLPLGEYEGVRILRAPELLALLDSASC